MLDKLRNKMSVRFNEAANRMTSIKPYEIGIAFGMGVLAMPFSPFVASIAFALPTLYVGTGYILKFAGKLATPSDTATLQKPASPTMK